MSAYQENSTTSQKPIFFTMKYISRSEIPKNIYLCERSAENDWKYIALFTFSNRFKFVIGSNFPIDNHKDSFLEDLEFNYNYMKDIDNYKELSISYFRDFEIDYNFKICRKIFNYFSKNSEKIKEILDYFN